MTTSRRDFLEGIAAVWLAGALACRRAADPATMTHRPPPDAPAPPRVLGVLTPEQAEELEAVAARIIPTDDTPGAREAGVIWFIDAALAGFASGQRQLLVDGLDDLRRAVGAAHPGQTRFASLSGPQQDAVLRGLEQTPFFGTIRFATIAGMFALPKYGGNTDWIGWDLIGQDRAHEFAPPFGWYDHPDTQRALLGRVL